MSCQWMILIFMALLHSASKAIHSTSPAGMTIRDSPAFIWTSPHSDMSIKLYLHAVQLKNIVGAFCQWLTLCCSELRAQSHCAVMQPWPFIHIYQDVVHNGPGRLFSSKKNAIGQLPYKWPWLALEPVNTASPGK